MNNLEQLSVVYWNRFLSRKYDDEIKSEGGKLYQFKQEQRKSDVVYVLGCGASINQVSDQEWEEISQHYSIGVNAFYVHEFNPNAYFTEFVDNKDFEELVYEKLLDNPDKLNNDVFISSYFAVIESSGYREPKYVKPQFYSPDRVRLKDPVLLSKLIAKYYREGSRRLCHQVSNLDVVINFCVTKGYKKIILVGVDLNNDGYFWESRTDKYSQKAQSFMNSYRKQKGEQTGGVHATASEEQGADLGRLNIVDYIYFLNSKVLVDINVEICVVNPDSLLAAKVRVVPICGNDVEMNI